MNLIASVLNSKYLQEMYFLRLKDPLMTVLFENDEIIAIDKPYGINAHTNDSKALHQDFIQDGLIEIYEKQLGIKLSIVHRLDQTTTGVIIFAKSQEAAKKYAEYFFLRQVQKTYVFITAEKSVKKEFKIDKIIIHKAKELESNTDFKFLKKNNLFEMWEASPHTGRNHQIRIHAEAAGIPLLGDTLYHGEDYPFLCLHNRKIEFPNGIVIESRLPVYFQNLELLGDQFLAKAFFEIDRRERLFHIEKNYSQSCRLIHNKFESEDMGYTLDLLGDYLVLHWFGDNWSEEIAKQFLKISKYFNKIIFVKLVNSGNELKQLIIGNAKDSELTVCKRWIFSEGPLRYEARTDSGKSIGFYPDQRMHRYWLLSHSKDKKVLNAFAYTCTLSLAAAFGGAQQVTSVEANKSSINWGRFHFEMNEVPLGDHLFYCRDSFSFLDQCISKNLKYDLMLCEVPSFYRGEKGIFKVEKDLETIIEKCLRCLSDHGEMLFSVSSSNIGIVEINDSFKKIQNKLDIKKLEIFSIHSGFDFELPGKKAFLKSFLIRTF